MDITSYLLGKGAASGGAKLQNKSVTITENTTTTINPDSGYDGLKKVDVTTNVSGGGTPTTITEIVNTITSFNNYLDNLMNNYSAYTNNSLTIYTPNQSANKFMIQKRSNGKYRIVWSTTGFYCCLFSSVSQGFCNLKRIGSSGLETRFFSYYNQSFALNKGASSNAYDNAYYSSEYSTLEELITALQTKNAISYTNYTSGFTYSGVLDSTWTAPITNIPIFESDMSTPVVNGKVLSHNLTISY